MRTSLPRRLQRTLWSTPTLVPRVVPRHVSESLRGSTPSLLRSSQRTKGWRPASRSPHSPGSSRHTVFATVCSPPTEQPDDPPVTGSRERPGRGGTVCVSSPPVPSGWFAKTGGVGHHVPLPVAGKDGSSWGWDFWDVCLRPRPERRKTNGKRFLFSSPSPSPRPSRGSLG